MSTFLINFSVFFAQCKLVIQRHPVHNVDKISIIWILLILLSLTFIFITKSVSSTTYTTFSCDCTSVVYCLLQLPFGRVYTMFVAVQTSIQSRQTNQSRRSIGTIIMLYDDLRIILEHILK